MGQKSPQHDDFKSVGGESISWRDERGSHVPFRTINTACAWDVPRYLVVADIVVAKRGTRSEGGPPSADGLRAASQAHGQKLDNETYFDVEISLGVFSELAVS